MSKFQPHEPLYALKWFLKKLLPNEASSLRIAIYIRKMKSKTFGICWNYDDPLQYTVVINSDMDRIKSLRVIAHEAIHIFQYVSGKMADRPKDKVQWKDELLENGYEGSVYWNSPWEVEARAKQEPLRKAYMKHISRRKSKKFF